MSDSTKVWADTELNRLLDEWAVACEQFEAAERIKRLVSGSLSTGGEWIEANSDRKRFVIWAAPRLLKAKADHA